MLPLPLPELEPHGVDQLPVLVPPRRSQHLQHLRMSNHRHLRLRLLVVFEQVLPGVVVAVQEGFESLELPSLPQFTQAEFLRTSALINILSVPVRKEPVLVLNLDTVGLCGESADQFTLLGGDGGG